MTRFSGSCAGDRGLGGKRFGRGFGCRGTAHAPVLPANLKGGARVLMISNAHPEAFEQLVADKGLKDWVRSAVARCRKATDMTVTPDAGSVLTESLLAGSWG